jgi:hypothetical protein
MNYADYKELFDAKLREFMQLPRSPVNGRFITTPNSYILAEELSDLEEAYPDFAKQYDEMEYTL